MTTYAISGIAILVTALPVAYLVVLRQIYRPTNSIYSLFYGVAVTTLGAGCVLAGSTQDPQTAELAWRIAHVGVVLIPVFHLHFTSLVSDTKGRGLVSVGYGFGFLAALLSLFGPSLINGVRYVFDEFYYATAGPLYVPFLICWLSIVLISERRLWRAHRRFSGEDKVRTKLLLISDAIGFPGGAMNFLPVLGFDIFPWGNFALPIAALVHVYAVFAYRFLDAELVVRRTVLYSTLAGFITALYLVVVLAMERWFQGFAGYGSIVATTAVAFVIAICFNPIRDWLQALVDRALFKGTAAELAAQKERLLSELRRAEQTKAVAMLASGLAHEIKNPLTSIKAFTEHLKQKAKDPAFLPKYERIVSGEVERINLIVQQLLEFAKPVPPRLELLDIREVVDETLTLLSNELEHRNIAVHRVYNTARQVLGDKRQLKQVWLNLLLNSLDAVDGAGKIEIRVHRHGTNVDVSIEDNGVGISSRDLERIFEPFHTTKPHGTGLGMAIVQSIIKDHGGQTTISSVPGKGTCVKVTLPIAMGAQ